MVDVQGLLKHSLAMLSCRRGGPAQDGSRRPERSLAGAVRTGLAQAPRAPGDGLWRPKQGCGKAANGVSRPPEVLV